MVGSGAERRGAAERRRKPAPAPCSGVIPCIAMQGAGLRGRVGVVAERRLGGERNGNEVLVRGTGYKSDNFNLPLTHTSLLILLLHILYTASLG
jgi:hypothetical protein